MSNISIHSLQPPSNGNDNHSASPIPILLKLNQDILTHLKNSSINGNNVKLIVNQGNYSIRISDNLEFPCMKLPETLNVDLYSLNSSKSSQYQGRIQTRLNVITDSKKIKQIVNTAAAAATTTSSQSTPFASPMIGTTPSIPSVPSTPLQPTKINYNNYSINNDSQDMIVKKFIYLLALGPISYNKITQYLNYQNIGPLIDEYTQIYDPRDTFIQDDIFPNGATLSTSKQYILKDKSYKDLLVWKWTSYGDYERNLIINNINRALSRLGYSITHPLRKKLCEPPAPESSELDNNSEDDQDKKSIRLGGAILGSNTKNSKKSKIVSKRVISNSSDDDDKLKNSQSSIRLDVTKSQSLPIKSNKRKLSSSSIGSSDDDGSISSSSSSGSTSSSKKIKLEFTSGNVTSPSSEEDETVLPSTPISGSNRQLTPSIPNSSHGKKLEYYTNLAMKFKSKYQEYSNLYLSLQSTTNNTTSTKKEKLVKLFELHQLLSKWKKLLWDFDRESKEKKGNQFMSLNKHKLSESITTTGGTGAGRIQKPKVNGNGNSSSKKKTKQLLDY
ncbi:uncharacterized protein J8A68_003866 [[Candida] subhashii]|uniref:Uncharacterized protein n=1 Tax=[Candida] subhashii TaxID=561895 RepID=A0A8J5UXT6_9ASCO|nr:uncharacterized protein J8A68_003866 [[Candida] subhashii]KAG7662569.1 hypothetical protein J8A68_003866 [[Candida] subhashii]